MVKIKEVNAFSPADKAGISAGDTLVSVDGNPINDVLDYRYYITESALTLSLLRDGVPYTVAIKKNRYDDIGLEFDTFLMDKQKSCANNCIFCFIDQNPAGMRDSVYFKDDDLRLSFLWGNYVTLTNLTQSDIERIIKYRVSPVNISVHTMNPELRCKMTGNRRAGEVLEYLELLKQGGISINAQIVVCKGINDGAELDYTLHELYKLHPAVTSVSVVPAGLTRHRESCPELADFTREDIIKLIGQVRAYSDGCLRLCGTRLFYLADEFFIRAGLPLPEYGYYEDFAQKDNGVGLIALLEREAEDCLSDLSSFGNVINRRITWATGHAAYKCISDIAKKIMDSFPQVKIDVRCITNNFFGESVTVAGLICGQDLIDQLKPYKGALGEKLYIPSVMLRYEGDKFLDDTPIETVTQELEIEVECIDNDGYKLVESALKP